MTKIAVASATIGKVFAFATRPGTISRKRYCKRHGYDFHLIKKALDPTRHPSWNKIKLLLKILPNYDWVFWSDADSIIKNHKIPLTQFIDDDFSFIVSKDEKSMCLGEFLIKNTPKMLHLLHEIYEGYDPTMMRQWEQSALIAHLSSHPEYLSEFKFLPQRDINSYPKYKIEGENRSPNAMYHPGDFVMHHVGNRSKKSLFYNMYRHSDHWYDKILAHTTHKTWKGLNKLMRK